MGYTKLLISGADICAHKFDDKLNDKIAVQLTNAANALALAEIDGCGATEEEQGIANAIRDAYNANQGRRLEDYCELFKQLELSIGAILPESDQVQQALDTAWANYAAVLNTIAGGGVQRAVPNVAVEKMITAPSPAIGIALAGFGILAGLGFAFALTRRGRGLEPSPF